VTSAPQSTEAWRELVAFLGDADTVFTDGDRAVDAQSQVEGYRWLTEIFAIACDIWVWGDPARPHFVPIVGPTKKFSGDNSDAAYLFAAVDATGTYRVTGQLGDSVYASVTAYGGLSGGHYTTRVVGAVNSTTFDVDAAGNFELHLGPERPEGVSPQNFVLIDGDVNSVITRDYRDHPRVDRSTTWGIERLGGAPPPRLTDDDLAARLRSTVEFLKETTSIFPIPAPPPNEFAEPYGVPPVTYGWAASDAAYAMGAYELGPDEALVIEGSSPSCAFWSLNVWNPFLQTHDYRYERVTINGAECALEDDGTWNIVVSDRDSGHPNGVSTAGHSAGVLWFRWFLAESLPPRPRCRVVALGDLT
jgi:hypothetical protein